MYDSDGNVQGGCGRRRAEPASPPTICPTVLLRRQEPRVAGAAALHLGSCLRRSTVADGYGVHRHAVGFADAVLPPLEHGREKRPAPSRASCKRRVCGGIGSREGLHLRRRLMPIGPVPDGWAVGLWSADAIRSRLWRTPGYVAPPRGTGGGKQVLAWLTIVARTSLRMPARRPFGRWIAPPSHPVRAAASSSERSERCSI